MHPRETAILPLSGYFFPEYQAMDTLQSPTLIRITAVTASFTYMNFINSSTRRLNGLLR